MDQSPLERRTPPAPRRDSLTREPDKPATCPAHGHFMAQHIFSNRWSGCPQCAAEDEARARRQREESQRVEREQFKQEELRRRQVQSGVIGRFKSVTFDSFEASSGPQKAAVTACRNFVETLPDADGVWLLGPPGTGKTHLGSAMVNHVLREREEWAAIFSAREIVRMLRATWGSKPGFYSDAPRTESQLIDHLGNISLLVLDEVGVGFGSESEMVQLFDVLDLRYRLEKPTVLLSNLTTREIKAAIGDRLYDRLRERARVIPCDWESHRASAAPGRG